MATPCHRCDDYGVTVHPAWAEFYRRVARNEFTCQADYQAFWRERGCPVSEATGQPVLPPQEAPCECRAVHAA